MTKSHTIVMTFLLITIISVGVVRCKRATITDILQIWNNFWHTKGKNGMDTFIWMGSEKYWVRLPSLQCWTQGHFGNIRSTDWDNTGMLNVIANEQAAPMSLIRLQSMGITEDQIINLARRMNNGQQGVRQ